MADEDARYYLTDADRDVLELVKSQVLAGMPSRRSKARGHDADTYMTPEVYVVLTPPAGIPALDQYGTTGTGTHSAHDDIPGEAYCYAYTIQDADEEPGSGTGTVPDNNALTNLLPVGKLLRVYNLGLTAIPGATWGLAVRDKFGHYVYSAGGGGTVTSGGGPPLTTIAGSVSFSLSSGFGAVSGSGTFGGGTIPVGKYLVSCQATLHTSQPIDPPGTLSLSAASGAISITVAGGTCAPSGAPTFKDVVVHVSGLIDVTVAGTLALGFVGVYSGSAPSGTGTGTMVLIQMS